MYYYIVFITDKGFGSVTLFLKNSIYSIKSIESVKNMINEVREGTPGETDDILIISYIPLTDQHIKEERVVYN